jgi:beta-propeller repeat-containing protein/putative Ig domain-containing protein
MLWRSGWVLFLATAAVGPRPTEPRPDAFRESEPRNAALSYLECNRGQSDRSVDFLATCDRYKAWIRATDVVVALPAARPSAFPHESATVGDRSPPHVLDVRLVGATAGPASTEGPLSGASNYFIGRDESKWVVGAPHVRRACYAGAWPGVDVTWSVGARRLQVAFGVGVGCDPRCIGFAFEGSQRVGVAGDGSLRIGIPGGEASLSRPVAFQPGGRRVEARWVVRADGSAGFDLGEYDEGLPLMIDPTLAYSTFLGGSSGDAPGGVAVDPSGNVYVGGTTQSSDLPVTSGTYLASLDGGQDAFCIKMNPSGSVLSYCTYIGGSLGETGTGLAVDSSGNAFLAGYTGSTDFPVTAGAAATRFSGSSYAGYVIKLNASGTARTYATYVNNGYLWSLAIDASGNAYVATNDTRIGIFKVNGTGTSFSYSTFYGVLNATQERAQAIAVDSAGNAYVVGYTDQSSFPTMNGSYDTTYGGGARDGFAFKLNSTGNVLWSTFLGGSDEDEAFGVAIDPSDKAWIAGYTKSSNFPTTSDGYATSPPGSTDAFLTRIAQDGSALEYATYFGGTSEDYGFAVAARGIYVVLGGMTASTDLPTQSPTQSSSGGYVDAFLAVLRNDGALAFSTYLGGAGPDGIDPQCLAASSSVDAVAWVRTASSDFPTQNAYDTTINGTSTEDGGLVKISGISTQPPEIDTTSLPVAVAGRGYRVTIQAHGGTPPLTWSLRSSLPAGIEFSEDTAVLSGTPTGAGSIVEFGYADDCGVSTSRAMRLDVAALVDLTRHAAKSLVPFVDTAGRNPAYFALELLEGTIVDLGVAPKPKGDLPVEVVLLGPDGVPIDLSAFGGVGPKGFRVRAFEAPASGRYLLRLTPIAAFTGTVKLTVRAVAKTSFGGTIHLEDTSAPTDLRIPVLAGAKVVATVKAAKGTTLVPVFAGATQDSVDLVTPGDVRGKGRVRSLKLSATLASGDLHVLVGAEPGTVGDAEWKVTVHQPKTYTFSMADVAVGE